MKKWSCLAYSAVNSSIFFTSDYLYESSASSIRCPSRSAEVLHVSVRVPGKGKSTGSLQPLIELWGGRLLLYRIYNCGEYRCWIIAFTDSRLTAWQLYREIGCWNGILATVSSARSFLQLLWNHYLEIPYVKPSSWTLSDRHTKPTTSGLHLVGYLCLKDSLYLNSMNFDYLCFPYTSGKIIFNDLFSQVRSQFLMWFWGCRLLLSCC